MQDGRVRFGGFFVKEVVLDFTSSRILANHYQRDFKKIKFSREKIKFDKLIIQSIDQ